MNSIDDEVFLPLSQSSSVFRKEKSARNYNNSTSSCDSGIFEDSSRPYRVLFLGPPSVGKTSIITQFLHGEVSPKYRPTIHQMFQGDIELAHSQVTLDIEDTGGDFTQEFPAMTEVSLKAADGIILVFSLADQKTFEDITLLRDFISLRYEELPIVIVGNKADLERKLPRQETEATVNLNWECGYVECSAKDGTNVDGVFRELARQTKISYSSHSSDDIAGLKWITSGNKIQAVPLKTKLLSEKKKEEVIERKLSVKHVYNDMCSIC